MKLNRNITDRGLKYLKDLIELDLMKNENITSKGLQNLEKIQKINIKYN